MNSYCVPPLSTDEIEETAMQIRVKVGLAETPCFPIVRFFELGMNCLFPEFNYLYVDAKEMKKYERLCGIQLTGKTEGLTLYKKPLIVIRGDVMERAAKGQGRARYTLAHEIGHYILHRQSTIVFPRGGYRSVPIFQSSEWQANAFAAALLMPKEFVRDHTAEEIMEECGVSLKAAEIRIQKMLKR